MFSTQEAVKAGTGRPSRDDDFGDAWGGVPRASGCSDRDASVALRTRDHQNGITTQGGASRPHTVPGRTHVKSLKVLLSAVALGAVALTSSAFAQDKGLIGIAMPTQSSLRWISDGNELKAALEAKGYTVDLQYAEDDIANQLAQLENMLTKGPKALVIASIDGTTLSTVLQAAADAGTKVVAYDRLIRQSPQCRLLHDLRQLPGRRAPGQFAR